MEYKVVIQENLDSGNIFIHNFYLDPCYLDQAMQFMKMDHHSDCIFIVEYALN